MRFALAGLLAMSLAACSDGNPIAPPSGPDQPPATLAEVPLQDALERIVPSLGTGAAVEALTAALTRAAAARSADAAPAVEAALARVVAEQPDLEVEADVIRLAMSARP
jgi:hypothetical protein